MIKQTKTQNEVLLRTTKEYEVKNKKKCLKLIEAGKPQYQRTPRFILTPIDISCRKSTKTRLNILLNPRKHYLLNYSNSSKPKIQPQN